MEILGFSPGSSGGKFGMKKKKHHINGPGGGLGGMVSAMIPGAKVDNKGRIMVNVGTSKETLTFNIGGCLFETYRLVFFERLRSYVTTQISLIF